MPEESDWTFKTLEKYFERVIKELNERYEQRFKGQESALSAALISTEKAINAAKEAQDGVNTKGNEFRASLEDYQKNMLSRNEARSEFKQIREAIQRNDTAIIALQVSHGQGTGESRALAKAAQQRNWIIGIIVACILNFIGITVGFIYFILQTK